MPKPLPKSIRENPVTTEVEHRTLTIAGIFTLGASFGADASLMTSDQTFLRLFPPPRCDQH